MKLIKTIHDLIDYIIDKGHGAAQRRKEIDLALYDSSVSLFEEYLDIYERTKKVHENLSPFEVVKTFASNENTNGKYNKPEDYRIYTLITTDNLIPVDVVPNSEWANRNNDPIDLPTEEYPIARIGSTTIEVEPKDTILKMIYLKDVPFPVYATDNTGAYDDANSVDVGWGKEVFIKLVSKTLSKIGINLREPQIIQYSASKEATEAL